MMKSRPLLLALTGLLVVLLSGCGPAAGPPPPPPPPQVTVSRPIERDVVDSDEFTARLSAVDSVEIRARVNGTLQQVKFKDGQIVKKGDLLEVIDPRPYQAELDRSQAELARARTQFALSEKDFKRAVDLFQSKAISAEEFDTRQQNRAGAEAAVKSAQATVETAQLNVEYCNISAPITGRVGRALVTEGNLVSGSFGASTLLTTLVSIDPIYAYVDVDESTVIHYQNLARTGARRSARDGPIPCELALGNTRVFDRKGVVDFVDNQFDANTGTLRVRGVFANGDGNLVPGQFGLLRVAGSGRYRGLLVPDFAIGSDQEKKTVLVVDADKKIASKQVVLGPLQNGLRVIRSGLDAKDLVVLDRLQILQPGMTVQPTEKPVPPPPGPAEAVADPGQVNP